MSNRVRRANKATASQLLAAVSGVFDLKDAGYSIQVYTSSELSDVDKVNIWDIFEQNMRDLYGLPTLVIYAH
ncbi:hypothetical protein BGY98DRAFT_1093811 [Russula aff. rugulosa BPL654]|nr:hypothetical protein BGY98DRAFT_1093811 [Russula aff. rugulosa BPL654]